MAHERLVGVLRVEKPIEKCDDLSLILRGIKVGSDAGEIDALAQVIGAAILQHLADG